MNGNTPVNALQPEDFRGHILDPEVAAIPRVPDDSQQVTTGPQPEVTAPQPVTGFQPEILAQQNAQPEVTAQQPPVTDAQPEVTGFQPEIVAQQNAQPQVLNDPTGPELKTFAPTGPRRRTPKQPVTGSYRRFKTARRSYF